MTPTTRYSYKTSLKSNVSDELINTFLLRPLAGLLVWPLYRTRATPNQVTAAAIAVGAVASLLYLFGTPSMTMTAGLCLTLKDILDSADGQLARAKQMFSRAGRFLDSIGDFVVNLFVFAAIGATLFRATGNPFLPLLALLGFLGISLRVSYHVFYQTSFLHLQNAYSVNRVTEEILVEDRHADPLTLRLQSIFRFLYSWQDAGMVKLDRWCGRGKMHREESAGSWYGDRTGVRLSGFLGMGTELFVLTACSIANSLELYLVLNLFLMNGLWLVCVYYRRHILARRLEQLNQSPP